MPNLGRDFVLKTGHICTWTQWFIFAISRAYNTIFFGGESMKARIVFCMLFLLLRRCRFSRKQRLLKISQWLVLGPAEILANGAALPAGDEAALEYDFLVPARSPPRSGRESAVEHPAAAWPGGPRPPVSPGPPGSRRSTWPFTWKASAGCRPTWPSKRLFRSGFIWTARRCPSPPQAGRKPGRTATR